MTFDEYQQLPNKEWWQITDRGYWDAGAASRDAEIAELVAALEWVRKVTVDIEMHDAIDFALAKVRKP